MNRRLLFVLVLVLSFWFSGCFGSTKATMVKYSAIPEATSNKCCSNCGAIPQSGGGCVFMNNDNPEQRRACYDGCLSASQ